MTDFDKVKVGFVLALLGAVFAISPAISAHLSAGYELFGHRLTLELAYTTFATLLGLAVYIFAIDFATQRPLPVIQAIGNVVYVVALAVPPVYFLLYAGAEIAAYLARALDSENVARVAELASGLFVVVASSLVSAAIFRLLARRERNAEAGILEEQEATQIQRASQLRDAGYLDMAILEAFRAIETSLRATVLRLGLPLRRKSTVELLGTAVAEGIVPAELSGSIDQLRTARNNMVHGRELIEAEEANFLLGEARKILGAIRRHEERESEPDEGST